MLIISPTFPHSNRVLCKNCLGDIGVCRDYVKKGLNVLPDQHVLVDQLPFTEGASRKNLVLKEDVAGLYKTSWELFVQGSSEPQRQKSVNAPFLPIQKYAYFT